jgi:hypothetical protein
MTKQSKTTIEPGDIKAVEILCSECKSTISRSIENLQNNLPACPNCGISWMPYRQSLIHLADTVTRLRHLASLPLKNPQPTISIRFELIPDEQP